MREQPPTVMQRRMLALHVAHPAGFSLERRRWVAAKSIAPVLPHGQTIAGCYTGTCCLPPNLSHHGGVLGCAVVSRWPSLAPTGQTSLRWGPKDLHEIQVFVIDAPHRARHARATNCRSGLRGSRPVPPLFDRAVAGSGRAFSGIERAEQLWGPAGGLVGPVRAATGLAGSSAVMALGWLPPLQQGHRPVTFARSQPLTAAVLSTSRSTSDTRPSSRSATGQPAFPRALSPRDKAASQPGCQWTCCRGSPSLT